MNKGIRRFSTHGTGALNRDAFRAIGENVIFEAGALVFHPESISLGSNIYVGHYAILKSYYTGSIEIGDDTWIGQQCMFHGAGGIRIGSKVGIGPGVRILTSQHEDEGPDVALIFAKLTTAPVIVRDGADIGWGAIVLPGVTVGQASLIGAGSVVTKDVPAFTVVAGVPARVIRSRTAPQTG